MPFFGGVNIFGTAVVMITTDQPREKQINGFFGLNGLETLDGGSRGRTTEVRGLLEGSSAANLALTESAFRSYADGQTRVLVDNLGSTWANVCLETFAPAGRVRQSPQGVYFRTYRARFLHLV